MTAIMINVDYKHLSSIVQIECCYVSEIKIIPSSPSSLDPDRCLHLTLYKVHPACSFDMGTEPSLVSTRDVILRFFSQYLDAKWAFKHGEFTLNWDSWS